MNSQFPTSVRSRSGFSLVEVTLTLAIVSVALLPILGMLGSGRGMQRESEDRFVAADLSQALVSQLRLVDSKLVLITAAGAEGEIPEVITIGNPVSSKYLSIIVSCDRSGGILDTHLEAAYSTGLNTADEEMLYLVQIEIEEPKSGSAGDSADKFGVIGFRKVTISIEQPAFVSQERRTKRVFQTFKSFSGS